MVVGKAYDFLLWLLPKAEKFSRSYRFSVGERLVAYGLDLLLVKRRVTSSVILAIVKFFPERVTPNRIWCLAPASTPRRS